MSKIHSPHVEREWDGPKGDGEMTSLRHDLLRRNWKIPYIGSRTKNRKSKKFKKIDVPLSTVNLNARQNSGYNYSFSLNSSWFLEITQLDVAMAIKILSLSLSDKFSTLLLFSSNECHVKWLSKISAFNKIM